MIENYESLKIISNNIINSPIKVFMKRRTIFLEFDILLGAEIIKACQKLEFTYEQNTDTSIEILVPNHFYINNEDFMSLYEAQSDDDFNNSLIVIFDYKNDLQIKEKSDNFKPSNALIFNFKSYLWLREYLCSKEDLVEHHNLQTREVIIVSQNNKKGIVKLKYEIKESRVSELDNLSLNIDTLLKGFKEQEFIYLFKDRVLDLIEANQIEKDRFFTIIKNLPTLLNQTQKDYQLFLKKFNFENIKNRFRDDRIKYFDILDKNLDNIGKQISSVPLTFSATAFAGYQVKDKYFILFLIFLGFTIYSFLSWKMLNLSLFNVKKLEEDLDDEYKLIKDDYNDMLESLDKDFGKIREKISRLKSIIFFVKCSLCILLTLFLLFSMYEIIFSISPPKIKEYILTL